MNATPSAAVTRMGRVLTLALPFTICAAAALPLSADSVGAQDFTTPLPPGPSSSPLTLIERGLAPAAPGVSFDAAVTRWFGVPDLDTRVLAMGASWHAARAALGWSATGDPEIGWNAFGAALGAADSSGGAALRVVARRDRTPGSDPGPLGAGLGVEAGGAAWLSVGGGVLLWASVPAAWSRGASPPLERGLEVGTRLSAGDLSLWVAREATAAREQLAAGVVARLSPLALWLEARDRPLRGSLGLSATVRGVTCAAAVESHPVLGETVKLALSLAPRRGR